VRSHTGVTAMGRGTVEVLGRREELVALTELPTLVQIVNKRKDSSQNDQPNEIVLSHRL